MRTATNPRPPASRPTQFPVPRLFVLGLMSAAFVLLAACSNEASTGDETTGSETNDSSPATSPVPDSSTTSTMLPEEDAFEARVAAIEAMIEDRNAGDFEAWLAHYTPDGPVIFGSQVTDVSDLEYQRSFMAANEVWTITGECSPAIAGRVSCPLSLKNEFHGPAGLWFEVPALLFQFSDDGLISRMSANSWDIAGDPQDYNAAFDAWLAQAHPEVHAGFGEPVEGEDGLPNADDMPIALGYVDEFVAQSDVYPLGQAQAEDPAPPTVEPLGRGGFLAAVSGELGVTMDDGDSISASFSDASDIVFAKITIPPGSVAPWHSHTGPALLVNVGPGTLTSAITEDCLAQEIGPGDAFFDPGDGVPHIAVNNDGEDVVLLAVFLGVVESPVVATDHGGACEL